MPRPKRAAATATDFRFKPAAPSKKAKKIATPKKRKKVAAKRPATDLGDGSGCRVCALSTGEAGLLLCEGRGCGAEWHWRCLGLRGVPRGTWLCPDCSPGSGTASASASASASAVAKAATKTTAKRKRKRAGKQKKQRRGPPLAWPRDDPEFVTKADFTCPGALLPSRPKGFRLLLANSWRAPLQRPARDGEAPACSCELRCGEDCVNRSLFQECGVGQCRCAAARSGACGNSVIQRRAFPGSEPFFAGSRGWGLRVTEGVPRGTVITEYCGQVITAEECVRRLGSECAPLCPAIH